MHMIGASTCRTSGKRPVYSPVDDDEDRMTGIPIVPIRRSHSTSYANTADDDRWPRSQSLAISAESESVHNNFDPEDLYPLNEREAGKGELYLPPTPNFTDPSFKTSPSLVPQGLPNLKARKRHPFSSSFEAPNWRQLLIHVVLCLIAYPVLQIFVVIARNKSLFWCRLFVAAGCGLLGFLLGVSLLQLGKNIMEAATWATVIHQSKIPNGPGVHLRDLAAHSTNATSSLSALRLLWDRNTYQGAARDNRRSYDRRPWTLFILFFLLIVGTTACLSFVFGRVVSIKTSVMRQDDVYETITVKGDLSDSDKQMADTLKASFDNAQITWTLAPFSAHGSLPPVSTFTWENDTVYFAETILSQLVPGGSGFGTFDEKATAVTTDNDVDSNPQKAPITRERAATSSVEPGSTLRFPRWGIRIKCARIPDGKADIIPLSPSNMTHVFVPRNTIQGLFSWFGKALPDEFNTPLNETAYLSPGDTLPETTNFDDIGLVANFTDNGVAHSLFSHPLTMGQEGNGWTSLEVLLIRMNTTYAPNGTFLRYSDQTRIDANGQPTRVGYDAAICLELYEPWVIEVYNSTVGAPGSTRIVSSGPSIQDDDSREIFTGKNMENPRAKTKLNSTELVGAYIVGHQNSVNKILKDNGRDAWYVPSPTILSYCDAGEGATGYTQLSEDLFARSRALADASNVLPYFVGSGDILARRFSDRVTSTADIEPAEMITVIIFLLIMGIVAALFIPKLPLSVPRRGFEIYSWMAAFYTDELVGERPTTGMVRSMEIHDIENLVGNLKFRYVS